MHYFSSTRQFVYAKSFHALDVLVIVAGALVLGDPLAQDADAVDRMIDVNVRAPYHAAVEAARRMNRDGRIIVIGSINADRMPFAGGTAYALTKSAMQGMVRGLARDFGERGITVNSVQPGPTDAGMNPADGSMADLMHGFMAIKRHIRPDEIAELAHRLPRRPARRDEHRLDVTDKTRYRAEFLRLGLDLVEWEELETLDKITKRKWNLLIPHNNTSGMDDWAARGVILDPSRPSPRNWRSLG